MVVINYKNKIIETEKDYKFKDLSIILDEFNKKIDYKNEEFNQDFFNKYNSIFEDYLNSNIIDVEGTYELPDLSEELL